MIQNKSLRHFETFVAHITYEYPLAGYRSDVWTGKFQCAYSLKTLNDHSKYGRGYGIPHYLRIVDVEFFLDKHDGKSSIPIYSNYSQISRHCSRNVLSSVAIDASNYILQTLPF